MSKAAGASCVPDVQGARAKSLFVLASPPFLFLESVGAKRRRFTDNKTRNSGVILSVVEGPVLLARRIPSRGRGTRVDIARLKLLNALPMRRS
jgi:hypothetical protein